ncbi:MAG: hypothetical protein ACTHN7_06210 [Solirubrobacterales bacterium]
MALVLLAAQPAAALTEPSGELIAGSEETVLRLHDLPPGYQIGDDSGCGPLGPPEGGPEGRLGRRYEKWLFKYWPEGCGYQYEQIFKVLGLGAAPPLVEAETLNTPSEAAASSGFGIYTALVERSKEGQRRKTVSIPPSGAQAFLLRSKNELVDGKIHQPATFLFWRSGKLISFVEAAGLNTRRNDRAALHFAQLQQERLEHPSPYTEAERDDSEVWLDDPGLKFPIYWVGNPFESALAPPVALEAAYTGAVGPPGAKLNLEYEEIRILGWARHGWKQFQSSVLGKINLHARCTATTKVDLPSGSAVVYAGYGRFRTRACPDYRPTRYYAVAHIGGMVIGVNLAICTGCLGAGGGPFNSQAGMEAILGALTVRPKPAYASG